MALLDENKSEETATAVVVAENQVEHIDTKLSFEAHVKRFKGIIENNRRRSVKTIWEIGAFVNVLKDEKTYGEKNVETFITEMDDVAVSKSEVYKYAQFAERYDKEQVNKLLSRNNIGWQVVANLIRVKDTNARALLEEKVDTGELAPSKIQDVVSNLNKQLENEGDKDGKTAAGKAAGPTVNTCLAAFKKMNNFMDRLLTNADACAKDITDLSAILDDETRYEKAVDGMEAFKAYLPKVRKVLDDLEARLDKTI